MNQLQRVIEDTDNTTTERLSSIEIHKHYRHPDEKGDTLGALEKLAKMHTPPDQPEVAEWEKQFLKKFSNHTNEFINPWKVSQKHEDLAKLQSELMDFIYETLSSHEEKVRADWLRREIEKLEGMPNPYYSPNLDELLSSSLASHCFGAFENARKIIITRYKEELLELEKGV